MIWLKSKSRVRLTLTVLVLGAAALSSVAIYRVSAGLGAKGAPPPAPCGTAAQQKLNEQLRQGVGSEVRFASAKDSMEQVIASVESVASFIYARSNLRMSDETKKKLTAAEQGVLSGSTRGISLDDLTSRLTGIAVGRLAVLSDKDIQGAAEIFSGSEGEIRTRACGKWGVLSTDEFMEQLTSARDSCKSGDLAVQGEIRPRIEEEVNERATYLSEALPNQFGNLKANGVTPLQSVLIAYSVASDDLLTGSQRDLKEMMLQKRMNAEQTRAARKAQNGDSGKPYGINGALYSTPVHLLFNRDAIDRILNPVAEEVKTK